MERLRRGCFQCSEQGLSGSRFATARGSVTDPSSSYLIDTDWLVDYLAGRRIAVDLFSRLDDTRRAISIVTCGVLASMALRGISERIVQRFARIRGDLRLRGLLIPDADLLIAATAVHHDLTLVIRNLKHFTRVPGFTLYPA